MFLENLGLHFDTVILIGMLLAFFLSVLLHFTSIHKNSSLITLSGLMFTSYFLSNHFYDLGDTGGLIYLKYVLYDVTTLLIVYAIFKVFRLKTIPAKTYIFSGLIFNSLLHFSIYFDLDVINNKEPWWWWSFYALAINAVDFLMVAALILNRDFLLINHCIRKINPKKYWRKILNSSL